jgi:aminopeptidase C
LIPDIEKFLPVAIFKMAVTILHKFNIVRFQWTLSWRGVFNSTLCDDHFENGDRQKFFNVGTSLSTHISNFDDIGQCWIFAAILKMVTTRNFSMSGINSGHHNLPTYEMSLKSDNVEFVLYCGGHFENDNR